MNADVMSRDWAHLKLQIKEWWNRLTEQDLGLIAGDHDALIATLQHRYGWAKRDAEHEVSRRFREISEASRAREPGLSGPGAIDGR